MHPHTFIFFGRSGSGKGTQAKLLEKVLQEKNKEVLYLETGDMFRDFVRDHPDNATSLLIKEYLDNGLLLPPFLPVWAWTNFLVNNLDKGQDMILDGLARRPDEAPVLDSAFSFYKRGKPTVVLINTSNEWCKTRLLERKRADDSEKDIEERLSWFDLDVVPAINFFKQNLNYNFIEINGEQSIEQVHAELISHLTPALSKDMERGSNI